MPSLGLSFRQWDENRPLHWHRNRLENDNKIPIPLQPRDGFLWNMGNIAGLGTSLLVGLRVPVNYQAQIGQASFWATYQVVTTGYGAGKGIVGLGDGNWEFNDVFNLLSLLPVAGTLLGSSNGT